MSRASLQELLQKLPDWSIHCKNKSIKTLRDIQQCRTAALGYHLYGCDQSACAHQSMHYHSCRNRHCPSCGNYRKEQWIADRMRELLPCKYFHIVFTVPHLLNSTILGNQKVLYDLLFSASHYTLNKLGQDPKYLGAQSGIISILHTWGQNLSFHPHIHTIVSGGGITPNGRWCIAKKAKYKVIYPKQVMEYIYKGRFIYLLKKALAKKEVQLPDNIKDTDLIKELYRKSWIVYAKQPFGGPAQVIEYLGRYTHKVAISNHRIRNIDKDLNVTFDYKDYRNQGQKKQMILSGIEFIRRFEQHILPSRFCKIRSYGLYSNRNRTQRVTQILSDLNLPLHPPKTQTEWNIQILINTGQDPLQCAKCKKGKMKLLDTVKPIKAERHIFKPPE